jgi:hypothetical protein
MDYSSLGNGMTHPDGLQLSNGTTHPDGLQLSLGLEVLRKLIGDFSHQLLVRFALFRFLAEYSCEAFQDVIPSMVVIRVSCVPHYQPTQFQILVSSLEQ